MTRACRRTGVTVDMRGWTVLRGGGRAVPCGALSSILAPTPQNVSVTPAVTTENVSRHGRLSPCRGSVPIQNHCSRLFESRAGALPELGAPQRKPTKPRWTAHDFDVARVLSLCACLGASLPPRRRDAHLCSPAPDPRQLPPAAVMSPTETPAARGPAGVVCPIRPRRPVNGCW